MKTVDEMAEECTLSLLDDVSEKMLRMYGVPVRLLPKAFKAGYAARDEEVNRLEKCLEIAESALNEIKTAFPREGDHVTAMLSNHFRLGYSNQAANSALAKIKAIREAKP